MSERRRLAASAKPEAKARSAQHGFRGNSSPSCGCGAGRVVIAGVTYIRFISEPQRHRGFASLTAGSLVIWISQSHCGFWQWKRWPLLAERVI
jgi:hypothetical protein